MTNDSPYVWDIRKLQRIVVIQGDTRITAYTRGALALALNRSVETIRAMEKKGVLCPPRLRTRPRKDIRGRWLYTREQILAMIQLAEEEGVLEPRYHRKFSARFVREAHRILQGERHG